MQIVDVSSFFNHQNAKVHLLNLADSDELYSGNKVYKLKYNIEEMRKQGKETMLTFGGIWSNHIAAVAEAGKRFGFQTKGIIRGEEMTSTLEKAQDNGMTLEFVSRSVFRELRENDFKGFLDDKTYIVPEGGSNALAVKGASEILKEMQQEFDVIACPVGTGGTLAGLIIAAHPDSLVIGFPALKGDAFLRDDIVRLLRDYDQQFETQLAEKKNWDLENNYHFGGFGEMSKVLFEFAFDFIGKTGILIDYLYNAKMLFGVDDLIKSGRLKGKILCINTGGLQGNPGMEKRYGISQE